MVVLADTECLQTRQFRGVTEHISAAHRIGWDLTGGYLFPAVEPNGGRETAALPAPWMTAALQMHLSAVGLRDNYTMHYFRLGGLFRKSLSGTVVDDIKKIGVWTTEQGRSVVLLRISGRRLSIVPPRVSGQKRDGFSKRKRKIDYSADNDLALSPAFQEDFAVSTKRYP